MENLNKNANYTYEEETIKFDRSAAEDVTAEKLPIIGKTYRDMVKKVMKSGKYYEVTLSDGNTCFGQSVRLAEKNGEIGAIARWAREEADGKTYQDWIKEFKANDIHFNGKDIPQFIRTNEEVKKAESAKVNKEVKTKEPKTGKADKEPTTKDVK